MVVPVKLIRHIRTRAGQMAFNSLLYNWSLGGSVPERFHVIPTDPWPGDADRGRWLCSGAFAIDGETLGMGHDGWHPRGVGPAWIRHMQGFEWLRDLRTLGGDMARSQAREMIASWCEHHENWHETSWRPDILGLRLGHWIMLYPFYGESADDAFQERLMESLIRQARHLARALPGGLDDIPMLHAIRGLAFCGLAFEGREAWLEQALDLLEQETAKQILPDGGHISRSPARLLEAARCFIDIRNGLRAGGYPVPEQVEHTIDRMAQALRFFRYSDRKFGLFNGAQKGSEALIEAVLTQANARGRVLCSLPQSGYERLTLGRTVLMIDAGNPPPYPYDAHAHAAPLSFEMCYGKERVFVACGSHPLDEDWRDVLRGTAAHNALSLDDRNVCEIREDGHFGRKPRKVMAERMETAGAILLDCSHDGYVPLNGITHRRRLYLSGQGHDLRGEESLTCSVGLNRPVEVAVRFHLHPRVQVSLIQDGKEALLRLSGGAGWRFVANAGALRLENSIYLGDGSRPRKTKQLVIVGRMDSDFAQIKWAMQREGR